MTENLVELIRIRGELEKELRERKTETLKLEQRLRCITNILEQLGIQASDATSEDSREQHRTVIRDKMGTAIAYIDVIAQTICITPTGHAPIDTHSPPFRTFFIHRMLGSMQEEDEFAASEGVLAKDQILSFKCHKDQGMLVKLVIHNYRSEERLQRIKSALNWTIRKLQEKREK